jgi:hypothetical protein
LTSKNNDSLLYGLATIHLQIAIDNGKPLARGGRKTTGLTESAGSPK